MRSCRNGTIELPAQSDATGSQSIRVIRDHSVDTAGADKSNLFRVIDCIHEDLDARLMELPNKLCTEELDGDAGVSGLCLESKGRRLNRHSFQQSDGLSGWIAHADGTDFFMQERGIVDRAPKSKLPDCACNAQSDSNGLNFQHQTSVTADGFQNIRQ